MSDGVGLATDIHLPSSHGTWPTILMRTPYLRVDERQLTNARHFTEHGFVFVSQDVRGRGDSEGEWVPFSGEFADGYDTVEWIAEQPWCNGQIGMVGGSYEAWVQWAAASRHPKHLRALAISGSPGRWFRDWPFRFGGFYSANLLNWLSATSGRINQPLSFPTWAWVAEHPDLSTLDVDAGRPLQTWQEVLSHDTYDEYWRSLEITGHDRMDVATLQVTGWWDECAPGDFHHFREISRTSDDSHSHTFVVGPWDHAGACVTGERVGGPLEIGPTGQLDMLHLWERWFSAQLKDAETDQGNSVRYFCLGLNDWLESETWPPQGAGECALYLGGEGDLLEAPAEGTVTREYEYDPRHPIQSQIDLHHAEPLRSAPRPELLIAGRKDVLTYCTGKVTAPVVLAGPARAVLFASSTSVDTDLVVSLSYAPRNGVPVIIGDGILRASMRDSLSEPTPLEPGCVYEFEIEINDLALQLDVGDELHVSISSSLVPTYHPNPNSGEPLTATWRPTTANVSILHGADHPSRFETFLERGDVSSLVAS